MADEDLQVTFDLDDDNDLQATYTINDEEQFDCVFSIDAVTFDYEALEKKPQINGVTLVGNKTSEDLSLQPAGDYATNSRVDEDVDTLQNNIDAEATTRANNDISLQNDINTLTTNLNTEITNRTTADATLSNEISQEASNREDADEELQEQITANHNNFANYRTSANQDVIDNEIKQSIDNHIANKNNPHEVTKAQVGLSNVDNTSDINKPISTATQTALNSKQDTLTVGLNIQINNNVISATDTTYTAGNGLTLTGTQFSANVTNNVTSTSITNALSANMGKELQAQIDNLKARGRYLSQWNSATGLAETQPTTLPYDYKAGDYFIVGTVGTTNYKPNGSQYTGVASTAVETNAVVVEDVYYYDGSIWHLQQNTQKTVSFANLAGQPTDNANLATALNNKYDASNPNNYQTSTQVATAISTHNTSTTAHEDIREKIKDIELFKFPNAVIIGTPTIQSGQVSNFSTTNYMQFPFVVDVRNKNFEIDFCFTTSSDVTTQQNILDSNFGLALAISNGKGIMAMSSNGTNWDIGLTTGTYTISANTTYYAKVSWNGTTYATALSTDGETYTTDMTLSSTKGLYPTTIYIGGGTSDSLGHTPTPFFGSINFNKCYLYVAGLLVWQGMDDAGLATRADVSLSNLDSEGTAKITYKAGTGIDITNNIISNTQTSAEWGNITGTLSNQTDLQTALDSKQDKLTSDNAGDNITIVAGAEVVGTLKISATVPTKTSELTNDSGYITSSYHDSTKQDVISDLDTIRSGAELGATALQSISSSDVTTALGYTPYNSTNPSGYVTSAYHDSTKQDTLTAGDNITITSNTISALSSTSDKIIWSESTMPTSGWYSVTYGDNKFVAISVSSVSAYSTDGITWTQTTLPTPDGSWRSVTYGNGKFVAIAGANSSVSAYSTDGITWTQVSMPTSTTWNSVAYGDNKFVAVAWNSSISAYSTDGINWVQTELPAEAGWVSVAYGNGKFVTVTNSGSYDISAYSTDGITWEQASMPAEEAWNTVAYGNGKFVALARSGTTAYSEDGVTWIQSTMPSASGLTNWFSVTYGDNKFVAVQATISSDMGAYSTDGITWTQTELPSEGWWYSIAYGNNRFVIVDNQSSTSVYGSSIVGSNKIANCDLSNLSTVGQAIIDAKQDVLTAGSNITISTSNIISVSTTSSVTSGSTVPLTSGGAYSYHDSTKQDVITYDSETQTLIIS